MLTGNKRNEISLKEIVEGCPSEQRYNLEQLIKYAINLAKGNKEDWFTEGERYVRNCSMWWWNFGNFSDWENVRRDYTKECYKNLSGCFLRW